MISSDNGRLWVYFLFFSLWIAESQYCYYTCWYYTLNSSHIRRWLLPSITLNISFHRDHVSVSVEFAVSWEWSSSVWRGPATCKSHRYHFQVLGFWRFSQPPSFLEDKQFKFTFPRVWPLPQTKIFLSVIITNNLHSWDNATMLALFCSLI